MTTDPMLSTELLDDYTTTALAKDTSKCKALASKIQKIQVTINQIGQTNVSH